MSVRYALDGRLARVVLADPARGNPLHTASLDALHAAVQQARADDAHVVLLTAEGPAWCVGGDLAAMAGAGDRGRYIDDLAESIHRTVSELARMDAVVVSAVQGTAAGAGVPLAAAADLVLAAASSRWTLAYTKIGFTPDGGSTLLPASLGLHRALHLALLNPVLSAAELQAAGLVAQVHPDDELAAAAEAVCATLLAGSRTAQVAAKRLLRERATPGAEGALRLETLAIRAAATSLDGVEGVDAFLAKRRPAFGATTQESP